MRGHPQGRCRAAVEVVRRKHEPFVQWIVVIAQHPFALGDLDIIDALTSENLCRHFRAGDARPHW